MRTRLAGAIAATAIAASALVGCTPPGEQDSDIKVTDQQQATQTFENNSESTVETSEATEGETEETTADNTGM